MSPQPPPPCCGAPATPPRSAPAAAATGKAAPSASPSLSESIKPVPGASRPHRRLTQTLSPHRHTDPPPLAAPLAPRTPRPSPRGPAEGRKRHRGGHDRRSRPPELPYALPRRRRSPRGGRCLPGRGHGGLRRGAGCCDRERFHRCPWSGAEPRVCSGRAAALRGLCPHTGGAAAAAASPRGPQPRLHARGARPRSLPPPPPGSDTHMCSGGWQRGREN